MTKRKLDCVIKESIQINTINKKSKLVDAAEKYSTNQNSYMLTNTELYSNKNIKLILLHHMQDKVIDVDIFDYDINNEKEEQRNKQQKKLIKKLKFDLYKFESSQLTEKIYILGQKDNNAIITAASIIRFYKQNDENIISIVPLIDYIYSHDLFGLFNRDEITSQYTDNLSSRKKCGILIGSEGIDIGKFIEVIKLRINNIDNAVSIDEDIKKIIEVPSNSYKIAHQAIVDKYKIEFQDNEGQGNYSSEEDEILDVIDQIKDTIEYEEIICEVVEQLITRAVKKSEKGEKNLSWDISVIDNEGRTRNNKEVKLNDREAIEIFAKAVEKWDLKLFKEAKDKSKDFAKLVDCFNEEIKYEFWGHVYRNMYYQNCLSGKRPFIEERKRIEKNFYHLLQDLEEYIFLIKNVPNLLDQLRAKQCSIIRDLPEDQQKDRSKDLIELIELKISVVDSSGDANDQIITNVVMEMINLTNGDLQGIKQDNTEQNKLDGKSTSKSESSDSSTETEEKVKPKIPPQKVPPTPNSDADGFYSDDEHTPLVSPFHLTRSSHYNLQSSKSEKESTPEKSIPKQAKSDAGPHRKMKKSLERQYSIDSNLCDHSRPPPSSSSMVEIATPSSMNQYVPVLPAYGQDVSDSSSPELVLESQVHNETVL